MKTVVGLFSTIAQAEQVKQALIDEGYEAQHIKTMANDQGGVVDGSDASATSSDQGYTDIGSGGGTGIGEKISSFFRNLMGGDDDLHDHYATGVNAGGALVAVTVEDDEASEMAGVLKQHGARDLEGGTSPSSEAFRGGSEAFRSDDVTGATAIPVVEEQLVVGKREVDRGGVRVYSHVVERPAEADVTLRDEQINVERRPVNRVATAADFGTGEKSFELHASGEEAVIGKTSRVVEEVLVGKNASERTEAVHDTVRKTEVEVEQIAGNSGRLPER